jgi:hypothetical protein
MMTDWLSARRERLEPEMTARPNLGAVGLRPFGRTWCSALIGAACRSMRPAPTG